MERFTHNLYELLFGSPATPVPLATMNVIKARFESQAAAQIKRCIPARPKDDEAWEILSATAW